MSYATVEDVQARMTHAMTYEEQNLCESLLSDAGVIIDAFNANATAERKKVVSCRVVARAIGDGSGYGIPTGATQGSMSAGGYSQSWTYGSGSVGELYLTKIEKQLLNLGNKIGSYSPLEEMVRKTEV